MFHSRSRPLVIAGFALMTLLPAPAPAQPDASRLTKASPVSCIGSRTVRVVGKLIETGGVAVNVMGSCTIIIQGSALRAGKEAVKLMGSGTVVIEGSEVRGKEAAIAILGTATVKVKDSVVVGAVTNVGTGSLVDQGGNTFDGQPGKGVGSHKVANAVRPEAAEKPEEPAGAGATVRCSGNQELTLKGRVVKADTVGVLAQGNCNLTLEDCTIEAGEVGIQMAGNAEVFLRKCVVKGKKQAALISGNGTLHAKDTVIHGRVKTLGNGELDDEGGNTRK